MSLHCKCGGKTQVRNGHDKRHEAMDDALGQARRVRFCCACGVTFPTVELPQSDVQELRRRAHLWEMQQVRG